MMWHNKIFSFVVGLGLLAFCASINGEPLQPASTPIPAGLVDLHTEGFVGSFDWPIQQVTKDKLVFTVLNAASTGILSDHGTHLETWTAGTSIKGTRFSITSFSVREVPFKEATTKILKMGVTEGTSASSAAYGFFYLLDGKRKIEEMALRMRERVDCLTFPPAKMALLHDSSGSFLVETGEEFSYPPNSPQTYKVQKMNRRWGVTLQRLSDGAEFMIPVATSSH